MGRTARLPVDHRRHVYADSTDYNHLWDAPRAWSGGRTVRSRRPCGRSRRTRCGTITTTARTIAMARPRGRKTRSLRFREVFPNPPREKGADKGGNLHEVHLRRHRFLPARHAATSARRTIRSRPRQDLSGKDQVDWLIDELKASDAPFKVSSAAAPGRQAAATAGGCSATPNVSCGTASSRNNVNGVMYVSGDIHRCDLQMHQPEVGGAYPFPEVISSGLGSHGEHDPMGFATIEFDTTLARSDDDGARDRRYRT